LVLRRLEKGKNLEKLKQGAVPWDELQRVGALFILHASAHNPPEALEVEEEYADLTGLDVIMIESANTNDSK
jgi:hypothetical protein